MKCFQNQSFYKDEKKIVEIKKYKNKMRPTLKNFYKREIREYIYKKCADKLTPEELYLVLFYADPIHQAASKWRKRMSQRLSEVEFGSDDSTSDFVSSEYGRSYSGESIPEDSIHSSDYGGLYRSRENSYDSPRFISSIEKRKAEIEKEQEENEERRRKRVLRV